MNQNTEDFTGGTKNTTREMPEPAGIAVSGGERTAPQDAGAALDEVNHERGDSQRMEERQQAGEVEEQTHDHRPAASNPDGGNPPAIPGDATEQED